MVSEGSLGNVLSTPDDGTSGSGGAGAEDGKGKEGEAAEEEKFDENYPKANLAFNMDDGTSPDAAAAGGGGAGGAGGGGGGGGAAAAGGKGKKEEKVFVPGSVVPVHPLAPNVMVHIYSRILNAQATLFARGKAANAKRHVARQNSIVDTIQFRRQLPFGK